MKFTYRIMALPVLTAVVLAVVFAVAFDNVREGTQLIQRLQDDLFTSVDLARKLELDALQLSHDLDAAISLRDVDLVAETEATADRIRAGLEQARHLSGVRDGLVSELATTFERYDALARRVAMDLIAVEGIPDERLLDDAARMNTSFEKLRDQFNSLTTAQVLTVRNELRAARERLGDRMRIITLLGVGTVILLLLLAVLAIVSIVRPLRKLRGAAAAIAEGNLDTPIDVEGDRDDDLGQLARSFREMQRALEADIAHREEVEHALRESEERLALALDAANDGIWDIDLVSGSFVTSDRFAAILGYTADEKPRTYEELRAMMFGVDDDELERLFGEEAADREAVFEARMRRKDGGETWVQIKGRTVERQPDGAPARMVGTISDISVRKQAEEDLHRAQDRLLQSEKLASLGRLVAGLVHELNSPLGSLVSGSDLTARSAQILRETPPDDVARRERALRALTRSVGSTAEAAARVQDLLGGLQQFTALDRAERQEADLHELIEATLTVMGTPLLEGVEVVRDYGELPRILCYPGQLNQLLLSLLRNAAEAMESGGRLTLTTRDLGDGQVSVAVADTGRGIPAHELPGLFEPRFRQAAGRVHLGWGLVTASRIADEHGGRITVDSEVGRGSTFTVVLPVRPGHLT